MERSGIIVKDPDILGGVPVFRGTRVPFQFRATTARRRLMLDLPGRRTGVCCDSPRKRLLMSF